MTEVIQLKNGIELAIEPIPFVRSIALGIWVGNGSRHESQGTKGMSHFIEHMLFKGTKNRSAKKIADDIDEVGGQINAYTSREYTCYHTRTLDTHFETALDVLSDMLLNSKFDDEEIKKERNVILEEINMYEDSPEELVHDLLSENIFAGNSLGYPILGTKATLSTFDSNTIKQYYENHYFPENIVVSVSGNVDKDSVIRQIEQKLSDFNKTGVNLEKPLLPAFTPCRIKKEKDIEQVHLCLGFPGITADAKEIYALTILDTIFGGGMSSRLFQRIREENGLAYSTYTYPSNYRDTGIYKIYAGMSVVQAEEVYSLILDEIQNLYHNPITKEQLSRTKEQIKSSYIISLESTINRMMAIGRSQLIMNRIRTPDELIEAIDNVTLDDIYDVAKMIFDMDKVSVAAVGKVKPLSFI